MLTLRDISEAAGRRWAALATAPKREWPHGVALQEAHQILGQRSNAHAAGSR